jgi:hypothetical protein
MKIEALIAELQKLAAKYPNCYVWCSEPEYRDWGNVKDPLKGVYL